MKISESWLREWVNPAISTEALVQQVTMAGLEVDAVEPVAGQFSQVVIAQIISAEQHPDAEKLRVCQVDAGALGQFQIVCGAANARAGIKVPLATLGAQLPGGLAIKKAKLRGVESFGMLCGQTELQVGDDDSGLWELPEDAPLGADIREYFNLDDKLPELDLTPNRSDCLSLRGIAREVGVLNRAPVAAIAVTPVTATIDDVLNVQLSAAEGCPRYVGRVIRNIDISKPSPLWLQEKLKRSGIRSIDAVVDVTNYVLLELGQPMHAFDLTKINGGINVRWAQPAEKITLLNDQELELKTDSLVIADNTSALALAGVMGGASSAVSESTQHIFLESAFFQPLAIAGRARGYGLHTDSSHRFERGVDYDLQRDAIERATQLLLDIVGGQAGPVIDVVATDHLPKTSVIVLAKSRILSGLGLTIPAAEVLDILQRLGLPLLSDSAEAWEFAVPSYRFDLRIDADLLEEIARIYGYSNLPTRISAFAVELPKISDLRLDKLSLKRHLVARGYQEVITYSFIDPKLHQQFFGDAPAVQLKNPISADMASMRTSLIPGLVSTLKNNINRQQERARLFEMGLVFGASQDQQSGPKYPQQPKLAGLVYGSRLSVNWSHGKNDVDFFDLKGDLESLLGLTGEAISFVAAPAVGFLHPGQSAEVIKNGVSIGYLGALHPSLSKDLGLLKSVFVFEITLDNVLVGSLPKASPISRFPEVSRDIAVVVDKNQSVAALTAAIKTAAGEALKSVTLFDVYSGQGIDLARKSLAFSLIFQLPSRTLTDEEIQSLMDVVVNTLIVDFNANLR